MDEIDKENETPNPALLKNSIEATPKEGYSNESIEEKRTLISYFKDCINSCGTFFYCCCYCNGRTLFLIFVVIINYIPLILGIIELILRNKYDSSNIFFYIDFGTELFCYFFGTISFIIDMRHKKPGKATECMAYLAIGMAIWWVLVIIIHFVVTDLEKDNTDELVKTFSTVRVLVIAVIIVLDIIALVIANYFKFW